ncbi:MAG: hypothetical protein JXO51_06515 [Candidatus Aminicenantes bacterium]|nr:hypothetical protein [Candidatus Aminicenantes bacterium]
MKTRATFLWLLLAAGLALHAGEPKPGWFVEAALGFSSLSPADFNARVEAQKLRSDFFYRDYYEVLQRTSGGAFRYTLEETAGSGLRGIGRGLPVALRLGRRLGPRLAAFAGLEFLESRRTSSLEWQFRVSDLRSDQVTPGSYELEIAYPDYFLQARAWVPQAGVILDLLRRQGWRAGLRLAVGPMLAALRIVESQRYRRTDEDGYWYETRSLTDMKGRGLGLALEAAARLDLPLSGRLGLHVEAGYALRRAGSFSGPGSSEYQSRDTNAASDLVRAQWQDEEWRTCPLEISQPLGRLEYTLSGNDLGGYTDTRTFRLDLSGWRLAAGLRLAL